MQGDILVDAPVLQLAEEAMEDGSFEIIANSLIYDVMIMSQSCDLVEGQGKPKIDQVMLCALMRFDDIKDSGHALEHPPTRKQAAAGTHPQYFALEHFADPDHPGLHRPVSFVIFAQTFALPIGYVRRLADGAGDRLRLRSTYREAVATRFGSFFGRIAMDSYATLPT